MKIVFLDEYSVGGSDVTPIKKLGDYVGYDDSPFDEVVERLKGADIAITNKTPLKADTIAQLPDLKMICVAATGMNNIDLEAAQKAGIVVRNAVDYSTHSVAEHTLAFALALMKQTLWDDDFVKSGQYTSTGRLFNFELPHRELYGKKWGIIGLGNIGKAVARLAEAFGCEVFYFSTSGANNNPDYKRLELDELLASCDIVSIHAPLSRNTYHLIDYHQLSLMKPTAVIINVARGSIVNEDGLARALNEGLIAGAGLDVYSKEPLAADNPINTVKDKYKLVLSPHSAWSAREALQALVDKVAGNIAEFLSAR